MSFTKIALKGSPTTIKQLETLGEVKSNGTLGRNNSYYYWLDTQGYIYVTKFLPEGYKLISNISELKSTKLFKLL